MKQFLSAVWAHRSGKIPRIVSKESPLPPRCRGSYGFAYRFKDDKIPLCHIALAYQRRVQFQHQFCRSVDYLRLVRLSRELPEASTTTQSFALLGKPAHHPYDDGK